MKSRCIHGIPCRLHTAAQRTLREVLDRIQSAQPVDYGRLVRVVREVVPLPPEETEDGTMGGWKADEPRDDDAATWEYGFGETPGILYVNEDLPLPELVATMAHELGHACTVREDLEARGSELEGEWTSELTAHWYAVTRWGFGAEIEPLRDRLDRRHHGPWPGETFSTGQGEFFIGEDYVCRKLS
jgi:hypothetical protein